MPDTPNGDLLDRIELPDLGDRTATLALWRDLAREAHQYVASLHRPS